jgi:hypothetical protein
MSEVVRLYKKYIRNSAKRAIVQLVLIFLCHLTAAVTKGINSPCNKVYMSTRMLKHAYDKRPAEEFDFFLEHIVDVIKYPDVVYKNKDGKRGSFCFVKEIKNLNCLVSLETIEKNGEPSHCEVVTFFRVDSDYLKSYELLWEWEGGIPPS